MQGPPVADVFPGGRYQLPKAVDPGFCERPIGGAVSGASKEGQGGEQERAYLSGEASARLTSTATFSEGFGCVWLSLAGDLGAGGGVF